MNLLTKSAAGVLGAAGASVVGCYAGGIIKFREEREQINVVQKTISGEPLTKDTNFSSAYSDAASVGKMYGRYLVGVEEKNKEWGEESYKKYLEDQGVTNGKRSFSKIFENNTKVDASYSKDSNNTKALNKVCESVYKKTSTSDIDFDSTTKTDEKYKLVDDLLRYCSPLGERPKILEQNNNDYGNETVGKTKGEEKKLVKAKESDNEGFWEAQQKGFKDLGSGVTDTYFSQFFETKDGNAVLKENENIKKICNGAYDKQANSAASTNAPTLDDVAKYCTFQKSHHS